MQEESARCCRARTPEEQSATKGASNRKSPDHAHGTHGVPRMDSHADSILDRPRMSVTKCDNIQYSSPDPFSVAFLLCCLFCCPTPFLLQPGDTTFYSGTGRTVTGTRVGNTTFYGRRRRDHHRDAGGNYDFLQWLRVVRQRHPSWQHFILLRDRRLDHFNSSREKPLSNAVRSTAHRRRLTTLASTTSASSFSLCLQSPATPRARLIFRYHPMAIVTTSL